MSERKYYHVSVQITGSDKDCSFVSLPYALSEGDAASIVIRNYSFAYAKTLKAGTSIVVERVNVFEGKVEGRSPGIVVTDEFGNIQADPENAANDWGWGSNVGLVMSKSRGE